jgi:hypothetical protein
LREGRGWIEIDPASFFFAAAARRYCSSAPPAAFFPSKRGELWKQSCTHFSRDLPFLRSERRKRREANARKPPLEQMLQLRNIGDFEDWPP